jgi:O-succinylbenzoic acid--CoA ligase
MDIVYHDLSRMQEVKSFIEEWNNSQSYLEVKSSGSTGEPKIHRLSKAFLKKSAERTLTYFNLTTGMKAGLCLSLSTIAGKMMVVRSILASLELHVLPVNHNPLKNLTIDLDFNAMVPVQALNYQHDEDTSPMNGIVLIGGAPLNEEQFERIYRKFPQAYQTYGMTETASHIALRKITADFNVPYRVLDGINISEKEGQLVIHCREIEGGMLHTNDCVEILDASSFQLLGRSDFVFISGGIKIHPEVLENRLSNLMHQTCLVVPVPDETWGATVGLVLLKNSEIPSSATLKTHFASSEIPRKFTLVDEILTTENGKIDRPKMHLKLQNHEWQALL